MLRWIEWTSLKHLLMGGFFSHLLDWSEAWAPLVPIGVWICHKKQPEYFKPVVFYIWFSLICNVLIDGMWKLHWVIPPNGNSNNWLYNLHSVVRLIAFSRFFILLQQPFLQKVKRAVPVLFLLLAAIDFAKYEPFFAYGTLGSKLMALEAGLLLFYCLQYYFYKVKEDLEMSLRQPDFWVVTGLGIYVAINFFIFLLYKELTVHYTLFAVNVWSIHNVSYIILQLFLANALYESTRR